VSLHGSEIWGKAHPGMALPQSSKAPTSECGAKPQHIPQSRQKITPRTDACNFLRLGEITFMEQSGATDARSCGRNVLEMKDDAARP
jgi:hypothetical protein